MDNLKILVHICIVITLYYLSYYFYQGFLNPIPTLGDSWDYHIPIAISILDTTFLTLPNQTIPHWQFPDTATVLSKIPQWYYPGSSEIFLSLFILLNIPMTFSNLLAIIVLFFCCYFLARTFSLHQYMSILFAISFITLTPVLRWSNAINIDIWMAIWFILCIISLENPQKSFLYFIKLGFILGMLIGSKYTGWYFFLTLFLVYFKNLLLFINLSRSFVFLVPFSLFGLFWYIRNYILTNNPFYPLSILGFEGKDIFGGYTIWNVGLLHPIEMLHAGFGEYKLWSLSIMVGILYLIHQLITKQFQLPLDSINKLFLIGIINFFFFLLFPTSEQSWIMVSSFRYSFPVFIPFMLAIFLYLSRYKKEEILGYFVIANILPVLSMSYYPKLLLIYLPLSFCAFYILNKTVLVKKKLKKN